ncbi:MAG: bacillithiol biosynthesis cysteine-adding enzyme BshC [Acidobacteria bacterium]|nr:bacillithiol biosynthesis cysteine-adding enzyme BshC [Acidobacteriota bacterium]
MDQVTARKFAKTQAPVRISSLSFDSIPGQSRLFLDYLRNPISLKKYYPNAVRAVSELSRFAPAVLANYHTDRKTLCDALVSINQDSGAGETTFQNIGRLREADCVAIVTGQQTGLFTGPLYTVYKAISAIKLAEDLTAAGTDAVPVFWAATEDHDLPEVSHAFFLDGRDMLISTDLGIESQGLTVGEVKIGESIRDTIANLFRSLPQTDFSPQAKQLLSDAWRPGTKVGHAFLRSIMAIFEKFGLIALDPQDPQLKRLSSPIYSQAIENADDIVTGIVQLGKELAADGYHTQVEVDDNYFPLFWHDGEGRRLALRKVGDGLYRAKDAKIEVTSGELLHLASQHPERLSPGVMLRPVVQDWLLPTLCYFGGAAEIAYFAQNNEVYKTLGRPVTPILHRQSITVVGKKQQKVLDRFHLSLEHLFLGVDALTERVAAENVARDTDELFTEIQQHIEGDLRRLGEHISQIDPTIAAHLKTRKRKIEYHLDTLKKKTLLASVRRDEDTNRQIEGLFASLLPRGAMQERTLNFYNFYNKFGDNFIEWLYASLDLEDTGHRIIEL